MQTYVANAATPIIVDFQAARAAARKQAQHPPVGTDLAARIFMACLVMLFMAVALIALRTVFGGGSPVPEQRPSRTFCSNLSWDTPLPFRNCFTLPGN